MSEIAALRDQLAQAQETIRAQELELAELRRQTVSLAETVQHPAADKQGRFDQTASGLIQMMSTLASELDLEESPERLLQRIVEIAAEVIPGAQHASISLFERGKPVQTPSASSEMARLCDAAQYDYDQGPCLEALEDGGVVRIDDMSSETRWPKFAARAGELGVASMLAVHLVTPRGMLGALNLFGEMPSAFSDDSAVVGSAFAANAGIALARLRTEHNLRKAIESRQIVGQAVGILMERHRLPAEGAFLLLVKASQQSHVKLHEIAARIAETGEDPEVVVGA